MELSGTVRMRYDPERRAAIMAWLACQGVDITSIPRLAKHSPTPQASEGEAPSLHPTCTSIPRVMQSLKVCTWAANEACRLAPDEFLLNARELWWLGSAEPLGTCCVFRKCSS